MSIQAQNGVEPFEFRGTTGQWFGIWIVNLLLTIVTIGIYSAWAKVRAKQYFYQHTYVAGRNFDYHATGLQILIGRFIVIGAITAYSIFLNTKPVVGLALLAVFILALPMLMVRALRFNAKMTSWSNIRFQFHGSAWKAALVYIVYPILTALTLYLTFPLLDRAVKRFVVSNHALGKSRFEFDAPIRIFYGAFLAAIAWVLFMSMVIAVVAMMSVPGLTLIFSDIGALEQDPVASLSLIGAIYAFAFLAFFPAFAIYQAFIRNAVFNNLSLEGGHEFYSNVHPLRLFWIALSNAVIVLCSLGLLLPFAQIRMTRYLASHTAMLPNGSLDHFLADADRQASAVGDAYADVEGIDLGLPI